ncbi:MAG: TVP38/TMEM64 family protein [Planctomycetaceae bacterium]
MSSQREAEGTDGGTAPHGPTPSTSRRIQVAALCGILSAAVFWGFRDQLSLSALVDHEARLLDFGRAAPRFLVAMALLTYVVITGLSLPLATVMTLVIAWLFKMVFGPVAGFLLAVGVVSCGSTAGATVCFLLSRYLLRAAVRNRFGSRLAAFNAALSREGPYFLFLLRLTPIVPFFVVNLVMGLTGLRVRTFWWVSQIGMLPGTLVYVYAGWSVPSLKALAESGGRGVFNPQLAVAFAALGLFPWLARRVSAWLNSRFAPRSE